MKIVAAVVGYNAEKYIEKCLASIMNQTYENFICYIVDDMSTDNTANLVQETIKNDNRFRLIVNTEKRYQGGNYDLICRDQSDVDNEDIVIEVDMDDYLHDSKVFERIFNCYFNENIWISNGSFVYSNGSPGFSQPVVDLNKIRHKAYTASHLRTWKVFLWRAMKQEDLKDENGNWWNCACDTIFMYDMLEMAGLEHYKFMPEINYVYNGENNLSEHHIYMPKIIWMNNFVKNKKQRERLIR